MTERIKDFLNQLSQSIAELLNTDGYGQDKLCPIKLENEQPRRNCKRRPYEDNEF